MLSKSRYCLFTQCPRALWLRINRPELAIAAGTESFYFHIFDATTKSFLPEDQRRMLASDKAYECIYK